MSVCVPTQQLLAAREVALALRSAGGAPSGETSQSLSNVAEDDEPSSNADRATDDANGPQAGGYPNSPAKSAINKRKRKRGDDDDSSSNPVFDHDEHGSSASPAASDVADGRDGEPINPNSDGDATSDFADDSDGDSTSSLDSKCSKYVQENGRWYHADLGNGYEYLLPNDEPHNELLDISHTGWLRFSEGKLYSAPIGNVQSVLDIGAGTGIWAIDFADEYPSAHVIGTDISPIQPTCVPPNLEFQYDDCNLESTFRREYFDFIHVRGMAGCISDCNSFAKGRFDDLKPGGYLEYKDLSMCFKSDDESLKNYSCFNEWGNFWQEVGSKLNRSLTIAEDGTMEEAMKRAGFTNITTLQDKMPVGVWPKDERLKETGRWNYAALNCDLEGLVLRAATRLVGWSYEEAIVFVSRVRRGLRSRKSHPWRLITVIYGQKPE
ncbi:SAM dependent methyltransferase [Ilyonectria destructans]|nr:SAM dependent methyltransferase [Ilyonectria destructans]